MTSVNPFIKGKVQYYFYSAYSYWIPQHSFKEAGQTSWEQWSRKQCKSTTRRRKSQPWHSDHVTEITSLASNMTWQDAFCLHTLLSNPVLHAHTTNPYYNLGYISISTNPSLLPDWLNTGPSFSHVIYIATGSTPWIFRLTLTLTLRKIHFLPALEALFLLGRFLLFATDSRISKGSGAQEKLKNLTPTSESVQQQNQLNTHPLVWVNKQNWC